MRGKGEKTMIWFISGMFCGVGLTVIVMSLLIKSKECENEN